MYATIDIETTGLNRFKDKITWIGIQINKGVTFKGCEDSTIKRYILDMNGDKDLDRFKSIVDKLREKKVKTVFQNGKFDTLFIETQYGITLPIHEDVMLMGTAYDLAAEHGLKDMAQRYLGVPDWDISKKEKLSGNKSIIPYLTCDVKYTWELFCYFMEEMTPQQIKIYKKILRPAYLMYRDTERNGAWVDVPKLRQVREEYKKREQEKLSWLNSKYKINWNSSAQVADVLFDKEKMPILKKSAKTGKPSADAEVLNKLAAKGYDIPKVLLEYKAVNTLNKMFLNRWEDDLGYDKRLHPSFNLTNVVSGRTSCLIAGTQVLVPNGSKSIESIIPGDLVFSKADDGTVTVSKVTWSGCTGVRSDLYKITYRTQGRHEEMSLTLTSDHLVHTIESGYIQAQQLKVGDRLSALHKGIKTGRPYITKIETISVPTKVYDITVENTHNFYANEICVHNCANPNLQQVPREKTVRGLFNAPEGRLFFEADYSQLELRIAAEYSHDQTMLDIYKNGGDIHTTTAKLMTGGREPTKEERGRAKAVNFGRP